jgi:hypothetical protein
MGIDTNLGGMLFTLAHICTFHLIATTHSTCVFPSLAYDMHIVSFPLDLLIVFFITRGVWNARTLNVIDEMCEPIYITSLRFSYTLVRFLYSRCSNGLFAICEVLLIKGTPWGPQHDH